MAYYFVDAATGNDSDNGTTFDLAWATFEHAVEAGGLAAGDIVFIRPNHSEIPTSDINMGYGGAAGNYLNLVSWPKPAVSITEADWTNGSTTVDNVVGASLTRTGHVGRMITGPDGEEYLITYITDSNTFIIDREYVGTTVTSTDGACTIAADDFYTEAQAIDDSAWTIKKTDWNANNPARAIVDFNDTNYQFVIGGAYRYTKFQGIEFKDSTDGSGIIALGNNFNTWFKGIIVTQTTQNDPLFKIYYNSFMIEECIIEGSGSGGNQVGILTDQYQTSLIKGTIKNCAIYNCGDNGLRNGGCIELISVNIGVEVANGDFDIDNSSMIRGRDVKLGGTNGLVRNFYSAHGTQIENYQKILGEHRTFIIQGYHEKVVVSGETPNKKISDYVVKIVPNINLPQKDNFAPVILSHDIKVDTSSLSFRYWVYNDTGSTLNDTAYNDNIWMRIDYIKVYDDTSEYIIKSEYSDEIDILDAADADDWDYIEVTGIQSAIADKVKISIFYSGYFAAGAVYVDPAVVIS